MAQAAVGIEAFFLTHNADGLSAKTAKTRDQSFVFAKFAVARERREIFDHAFDVIGKMRAVLMTCDLRLLPRREPGIEINQRLGRACFKLLQLFADRARCVSLQATQLVDLGLEFSHRFFEVEVRPHAHRVLLRPIGPGAGHRSPEVGGTCRFHPAKSSKTGLSGATAGADLEPWPWSAHPAHGCKFAWWRHRHGPKAPAPPSNRPRFAEDDWQKHGATRGG